MSIECVYSNVVDLAIPCNSKAIEKKRKIKDEDKKEKENIEEVEEKRKNSHKTELKTR